MIKRLVVLLLFSFSSFGQESPLVLQGKTESDLLILSNLNGQSSGAGNLNGKSSGAGNLNGQSSGAGNLNDWKGGDHKEIDKVEAKSIIINNINKIKIFFQTHSELVKKEFPEFEASEIIEKINQVLNNDGIEVTEEDLYDRHQVIRTAINSKSLNKIKYNLPRMQGVIKRGIESTLFLLNFHELLSLMDLEDNDPNLSDLDFSYPITPRLSKYIIKIAVYDLGEKQQDLTPDYYDFEYTPSGKYKTAIFKNVDFFGFYQKNNRLGGNSGAGIGVNADYSVSKLITNHTLMNINFEIRDVDLLALGDKNASVDSLMPQLMFDLGYGIIANHLNLSDSDGVKKYGMNYEGNSELMALIFTTGVYKDAANDQKRFKDMFTVGFNARYGNKKSHFLGGWRFLPLAHEFGAIYDIGYRGIIGTKSKNTLEGQAGATLYNGSDGLDSVESKRFRISLLKSFHLKNLKLTVGPSYSRVITNKYVEGVDGNVDDVGISRDIFSIKLKVRVLSIKK